MKIAYILTNYPTISETFIYREMVQLRSQGFEIIIFSADINTKANSCSGEPFPVFYRPCIYSLDGIASSVLLLGRPLWFMKFLVLFFKLLKNYPKDALTLAINLHTVSYFSRQAAIHNAEHVHAGFLSWPACIGLGVSSLCNLPFSISAHARDIYVESGAVQVKLKNAKFVTCCSRAGADHLKTIIDSEYHYKLLLNHHGIEIEKGSRPARYIGQGSAEIITAVGRLIEKKGFLDLIEAFSKIAPKNVLLRIVGDGPEKDALKNRVLQYGLTDRVQMCGQQDNDLTIKMIQESMILVVPSIIASDGDRDGIPNVILEAFSVGTCVIASDLPAITEAVTPDTGLLVKPGQVDELSAGIECLLADKELRTFLAGNARDLLATRFDLKKNCIELGAYFTNAPLEITKPKVVHIIEGFLGGTSTYLCNVLPALKNTGFDVTFICSLGRCDKDAGTKLNQLRAMGIKVHIIPMRRSLNLLGDLYSLVKLFIILNRGKYDIVHTHCAKAGALGRIASLLAGTKKRFHSSHCFAFLRCGNLISKRIYLQIERLLARVTTQYIAVSICDADSASSCRIFPDSKISLVCNGLSFDKRPGTIDQNSRQIKTNMGLPVDSNIVMTACRFVEYKGVFTFLEMAELSNSNTIFLVAGDGPLRSDLENHITRNNLSNKVRICGHISNMEILYSICDLVILCSQLEAQPYVILEAMRAKCPIIASDVPGNRELLYDNRGLLVEGEAGKLAAAVDFLLGDEQKRSQFIANAWEYVSENHTLENQISELVKVYNCNRFVKAERNYIAGSNTTNYK